jgi:lincosamide nucleotidyltransferase A/C/D/E
VAHQSVRCISPEWLVRFHTGYPVDDDDWADVSALCARFDLPVPVDYRRWTDAQAP